MSYADAIGASQADFYQSRQVYLDIITQPGVVYQPMTVDIVTPETINGSGIPSATVCRVKILSVGKYVSCVQPGILNYDANGFITYQAM